MFRIPENSFLGRVVTIHSMSYIENYTGKLYSFKVMHPLVLQDAGWWTGQPRGLYACGVGLEHHAIHSIQEQWKFSGMVYGGLLTFVINQSASSFTGPFPLLSTSSAASSAFLMETLSAAPDPLRTLRLAYVVRLALDWRKVSSIAIRGHSFRAMHLPRSLSCQEHVLCS